MNLPNLPKSIKASRQEKQRHHLYTLQKCVAECERHKITINTHIERIQKECLGQPPVEERRCIAAYLGDKSYDEWMMLYDTLIKEAEEEIEAYNQEPASEQESTKRTLLTAGAITVCFMFVLALFFLPTPVGVLTGNVIGNIFDVNNTIPDVGVPDGSYRLIMKHGLFGTKTRTESIDSSGPIHLVGKDGRKDVLELVITPSSGHGAYDTKVEILDEWTGPAGYEAQIKVLNEKPTQQAYYAVTGRTAIAIIDEAGNPIIPKQIGETANFERDWERDDGLLAGIRTELEDFGVETRLKRTFAEAAIPATGETTRIFSYEHSPESWVTFMVHAPGSGKLLLFDPVGSWWNYGWDYRCNITLAETRGIDRINEPVEITGGELSGTCPEIIGATEKSIRVLDNETEIASQVDDWDATKTGVNDADYDIDANDEIIFLANVSADETKTFWIYFDLEENASPTYTGDLNASFNAGNVNINNTYYRLTLDNSGVIDDIRSRLGNEIDVTENWYWNFFRTVDNWDIQDFGAGNWVYRFCGPVRCSIKMDGITGFIDTSSADTTYNVYANTPEIRSYKRWTMSANEGMQIGDDLNVNGGYTFSATGSHPTWIETDTMDGGGAQERTDRSGAYAFDTGWWAYRVVGANTDAYAVIRKYVRDVSDNSSHTMQVNWYDAGEHAAGWESGYGGSSDFLNGNIYEIANFYFADNASDADYSYAQEWYNKTIYALNLTLGGSEELGVLNATMDEPQNGTRKYRGEAFTMNGTVWCPYGNCGNVSAWSQYFSTVSPLETWTETTQVDFSSFNESLNITIMPTGSLRTETVTPGIWFDNDWPSRIPINISEEDSSILNDFQVNITLDTEGLIAVGKMEADCADLRFADENGTALPFWIEKGCNTTTTTIWVKMSLAADENVTIYAYYNNPGASSASSIDDVMEPGLLVEYWDDSSGSPGTFVTMTGTCTDTSLNYDWGTGTVSISDCPNNLDNDVSLRWTGWIIPGGNGSHDFFTTHDDGARFYIPDTNLLINSWIDTGPIETPGTYSFNTTTPIIWEWYENGGGAVAQLGWTPPGGSKVYPIPSSNLRSRQYVAQSPLAATGSEENLSYYSVATYISNAYDTGSSGNTFQKIYWSAEKPSDTTMNVYVRSSPDNVTWSTWLQEVNNTAD